MQKKLNSLVIRILKYVSIFIFTTFIVGIVVIVVSKTKTETDINNHRVQVETFAYATPSPAYDPAKLSTLPTPVQRYLQFTFRGPKQSFSYAEMTMKGEFRRPRTESFAPTTAEQTVAVGAPAFIFSATTTIIPGIWARAYDAFIEGQMDMKAKIMSTLTVVEEHETPALNKTSLRRWLLESALYPAALLPGGPVHWEPIDNRRARAIVSAEGIEASLVATFRQDGSLEFFDSEEDGDLTTPYHGSGEHVFRSDYRLVSGVMIPHSFTISRAAGGKTYPFWKGQITSINYKSTR